MPKPWATSDIFQLPRFLPMFLSSLAGFPSNISWIHPQTLEFLPSAKWSKPKRSESSRPSEARSRSHRPKIHSSKRSTHFQPGRKKTYFRAAPRPRGQKSRARVFVFLRRAKTAQTARAAKRAVFFCGGESGEAVPLGAALLGAPEGHALRGRADARGGEGGEGGIWGGSCEVWFCPT